MSPEFLSFWVRETFSNIGRNRLMSALAITTVTVGLFILGGFYLTVSNLSAAVADQTHKLDLVVMLKPEVTAKRRREIFNAVRIPQVSAVEVVLKDRVLREMKKTMPDIPLDDFKDAEFLSDELRIKLKPERIDDIFKVQTYFNTIHGVMKTQNDMAPARKLLRINSFLAVSGIVSVIVLGLAILLIIQNAIRLTIFARRREIHIMEMVGATAWFIRIPFLMEGIIYGLAGAVVAALLLNALWAALEHMDVSLFTMLLPLSAAAIMPQCVLLMLAAGIGFGFIGSWASLQRSLGHTAEV